MKFRRKNPPRPAERVFPIGFTFDFYGNSYTQFYVESNGLVTFTPYAWSPYINDCPLPDTGNNENFIAGVWDDLDPDLADGDDAYYQSFASCPYPGYGGACLVVLWDVEHFLAPTENVIFEIILFDDDSILIQIQGLSPDLCQSFLHRGAGSPHEFSSAGRDRPGAGNAR